jgi:competence CoiA-like predicted nuclease
MPFIAQKPSNGEAVRVNEITDKFHKGEELECPFCGDVVTFRERATDDRGNKVSSAHFWHSKRGGGSSNGGAGGCDAAGESPEHEQKKMRAIELLENRYRGRTFVEESVGCRVADCGIEFDYQRGDCRGVAVEVQYKNDQKPYRSVTEEYLKHGFAVHWVFVVNDDWDELFSAKEELEKHNAQDYWLGSVGTGGKNDLGDKIWFNNYEYTVKSKG